MIIIIKFYGEQYYCVHYNIIIVAMSNKLTYVNIEARVRSVLGSAALHGWKRPLSSASLNLQKRRTEPLVLLCSRHLHLYLLQIRYSNYQKTLRLSYSPPIGKVPITSNRWSTTAYYRSVIHSNAPSELSFDGLPLPMVQISSRSTKLSLGMVSPLRTKETPAACMAWKFPIHDHTGYYYY